MKDLDIKVPDEVAQFIDVDEYAITMDKDSENNDSNAIGWW